MQEANEKQKKNQYYKYRWVWCFLGSIISLFTLTQPTAYMWYVAYASAGIRSQVIWMYGYYIFRDTYSGTESGWFNYWHFVGLDYYNESFFISIFTISLILISNTIILVELFRILISKRRKGIYRSRFFIPSGLGLFGAFLFYFIAMNTLSSSFWGTYKMQFGLLGQLIATIFILTGSIQRRNIRIRRNETEPVEETATQTQL